MPDRRLLGFEWTRDAKGVERIKTDPHDSPETIAFLLAHIARSRRPLVAQPGVAQTAPRPEGPWLSDAIDEWRQERLDCRAWRETTWTHTYEPALRIFRELVSDERRPVEGQPSRLDIRCASLDRQRIKAFAQQLREMPRQHGRRTRDLEAGVRIERGRAAGQPRQSAANVAKTLALVKTFVGWAERQAYVPTDVLRALEAACEVRPRDEEGGYQAFELKELVKVFRSDPYRQDAFKRAWQYWAPLIALYTGARAQEIANLTPGDFTRDEHGYWMHLREGVIEDGTGQPVSRRLKSRAAARDVPLSPVLIELGLWDFAQARRAAGHAWLFDGLIAEAKGGRSRYISQWFRKHTRSLGVYEARVRVFHSLRSNFIQALEAAGVDGYVIDRVVGHAGREVRSRHYVKKGGHATAVPPGPAQAAVRALEFGFAPAASARWGRGASAGSVDAIERGQPGSEHDDSAE